MCYLVVFQSANILQTEHFYCYTFVVKFPYENNNTRAQYMDLTLIGSSRNYYA